jgi:subfamily B ATP-binding cassette protein MsbA|tara:strand:- start:256 stop:2034 length:1779 start_codon:yes stop_codon:yes gene_type:complete
MTTNPEKETTPAEETDGWLLYKRLLSYVSSQRLAIGASIIGFIIFAATAPAANAWLGWTVDAIEAENYTELRILSPLALISIVIVRGIGGFLGGYSMAHLANYIMHCLRGELVRTLVRLPSSYFDKSNAGRLVSKMTYDVTQVAAAASDAVAVVFREGLTVIGLLAFLIYIDWQLTLAFIVIGPVVGQIVSYTSKKFRKYSTRIQDSMGDVTQITNEAIKGHRVIRTFNAADFVSDKLIAASERTRAQNMKMAFIRAASAPIVQLIVGMALAFLVWLAMSPSFFADKSAGDFVAFIGASAQLAKPIRQLTQINAVIQRGISAAESIFALIDEDSEADNGSFEVHRAAGKFEFERVRFAYDDRAVALDDVSFDVKPGQTIALVGKSGSGKSSLVSLISRFYEYNDGLIKLDGVPIRDYTLRNLRDQMSIVTQDVVLFNGTISDNIAYGETEIDVDRLIKAATNAHAMEFISKLELGLETHVGDDAKLLSGGQRQRIAIARALLKDAPILILDEATSALDSESEQHIQEALKTLIKGRTTFVIAHRLSTIENADLILVMDEGKIIESGSHDELLKFNGHYSKLHRIQFSDNDSL